MKKRPGVSTVLCLLLAVIYTVTSGSDPVRHDVFQAVDGSGNGTYSDPNVVLVGIVLNSPEEMVDPTPNYNAGSPPPFVIGGQWQIFIQGEGDDHAGTAVYLGQNYSMMGGISYTDSEWVEELCRVNHDEATGYRFSPGDRVKVTGYYLNYRGKMNVNETHSSDSYYDFTIELIEPGVGLPQPETVMLDDLKDGSDDFIFDVTRATGCEHYQGRLIRVNDVSFTATGTWQPGGTMEVTDGSKTFPVKLGIGAGIYDGSNNLDTTFDIVGILDQEDSSSPYTGGYRIWVTNYDANGFVLRDRGYRRGNLPSDVTGDGIVDLADFAKLSSDWLAETPGLSGCN